MISNETPIPVFSGYYMKLARIDFHLGNTLLPINQGLKMAIEVVLHHYAYRPHPRKLNNAA